MMQLTVRAVQIALSGAVVAAHEQRAVLQKHGKMPSRKRNGDRIVPLGIVIAIIMAFVVNFIFEKKSSIK